MLYWSTIVVTERSANREASRCRRPCLGKNSTKSILVFYFGRINSFL